MYVPTQAAGVELYFSDNKMKMSNSCESELSSQTSQVSSHRGERKNILQKLDCISAGRGESHHAHLKYDIF